MHYNTITLNFCQAIIGTHFLVIKDSDNKPLSSSDSVDPAGLDFGAYIDRASLVIDKTLVISSCVFTKLLV